MIVMQQTLLSQRPQIFLEPTKCIIMHAGEIESERLGVPRLEPVLEAEVWNTCLEIGLLNNQSPFPFVGKVVSQSA